MKKIGVAWALVIVLISGVSAEAPESSSAAKALALSAVRILKETSPVKRSAALGAAVTSLGDATAKESAEKRRRRAAGYAQSVARMVEAIAQLVMSVKDDNPDDDADLAAAVQSASGALAKAQSVVSVLESGDRAAVSAALSRASEKLQPALDSIEKRRARRGGPDEGQPEDKKPGEKKTEEKKPDEGKTGRPGDY